MKFFKENSYDIIRLIINQVGITIFSLVLYTALGIVGLEEETKLSLNIVLSVFSTLFYFSLIYTISWEWGAKDKIRVDGGRMEKDNVKGIKMAFFANLPNFLLTFICAITFLIYLTSASAVFYNISLVFNTIVRLTMAMYLGILQGVFASLRSNTDIYYFLQAIGFFVVPIFAIATTQFGYSMGLKEKKIFGSAKPKK